MGPQKETDGTYKDVIEESVMKGLCITMDWTKGKLPWPSKASLGLQQWGGKYHLFFKGQRKEGQLRTWRKLRLKLQMKKKEMQQERNVFACLGPGKNEIGEIQSIFLSISCGSRER